MDLNDTLRQHLLTTAAGLLDVTDNRPGHSDPEYLRGMVELIADSLPYQGEVDWDQVRQDIRDNILSLVRHGT